MGCVAHHPTSGLSFSPEDFIPLRTALNGLLSAGGKAKAALDASVFQEDDLRKWIPSLRTAAPDTSQRAAFHENHGPNAGPIMNHEPGNAGDSPL